jgi:hypothetical protein
MYLLAVDTTQIQPYIFRSNRLQENIGASHLVAQATEAWAFEALQQATPHHNVRPGTAGGALDRTRHIEDPAAHLDAEVLYAGGGNCVVLFQYQEHAKDFTRCLSRRVLVDAPNLQLVIAQQPFDWHTSLSAAVNNIFAKALAEEKHTRALSAPLLGVGVTVECQSTGFPAQEMVRLRDDDPTSGYAASAEILAKLQATGAANHRLERECGAVLGQAYKFPYDFDHLGRSKGEHSYIAVVHADGNGMGQRLMAIRKKYGEPAQNRDYILALYEFSAALRQAALTALKATLERLAHRFRVAGGQSLRHTNALGKTLTELRLFPADQGRYYLPFRPLVFGGDDVTFVCDGRLGLPLAVEYLRQFEHHAAALPESQEPATACAGVAMVKTHYPFARAYDLADSLCKSAKTYLRKQVLTGSGLDWHFSLGGLYGTLDEIRQREYKVPAGSLTLRPVMLGTNPKEVARSWDIVQQGIAVFQDASTVLPRGAQPQWSTRHNKLKALRDALRQGPEGVSWFLSKFGIADAFPVIAGRQEFARTGWWGGKYCGYFDALELADWFVPLEEVEHADGAHSSLPHK